MAKSKETAAATDIATQIMGAMVRMPPKPHNEMRLRKSKGKAEANSPLEDSEVRIATLLCGDEQLARGLLSKLYPTSASSQSAEEPGR
jgi:hypothetical protein